MEEGGQRWSGRPRAAFAIRVLAFVTPVALSAAATHLVSRLVARPPGLLPTIVWWIGLSLVATGVLFVADKAARRLLPLAALLQLSLVFPDRAPSRFKAALRTQTVHQLKERVAELRRTGLPDDPVLAAETLIELIADLSAHDRLTRGHAERVRAYSRMIGEELDLDAEDLERLQWAGLLHDVGKLFVPGEILNKPGGLTDAEFEVVKRHPGWGAELCEPLRGWLGDWVDAVGEHHERWDGGGYPSGLAGEEIALAARIVSVADVYDVITSVRSYKLPSPATAGRQELARCAGTQFDPQVVRAFLSISLGRLRLVMGPLSWLAQLPIVGRLPVGPAAGAAVSGAATAVTLIAGGLIDAAPAVERPAIVEAAEPELVATTATSTTVPSISLPAPTLPPPPVPPAIAPPVDSVPATTTTTSTTATTSTITTTTTSTIASATSTTTPTVATPPPLLPPVAVDDAATIAEGSSLVIDVAENDARAVTASLAAAPDVGTVTQVGPTTFRFDPPAGWAGRTSFRYTIVNAEGVASSARVTITVTPRPDAPLAVGDAATTDEDVPVVVAVLANDSDLDGDPLTVASVSSAPEGVATTDGATVTFTPDPDAWGTTSFTYTIDDGTGLTATAEVTVTVRARPDAPVAAADVASVAEDRSVLVAVLANDVDVDGDPLTVVAAASADGTATTDGSTVTYTPAADTHGTHTVSYRIDDGTGRTATANVTITVAPRPDPPVAVDDTASVDEDGAVVVPVLANDYDVDGDPLVVVATTATDGTATTDGTTVTYTPDPDSFGTQIFTYAVDDGTGRLATASVTVTVAPLPDPPVAADDAYATLQDTPLTTVAPGVLANDSDEDGDNLTATVVTPPSNGVVAMLSNGSFTYTPSAAWTGTDSFVYRADDGTGRSDTATVTITVSASRVESAFYLRAGSPGSSEWPLSTTAPGVADPEPDHDADGQVGLTIKKGSQKLTETDPLKFQHWDLVPSSDLTLNGPVKLELWSTVEHFDVNDDADYSVWLLDCATDGTGCVTLASVRDVHVRDWNRGISDWVYREIVVGSVATTVPTTRMLRVRLMFDHHDVWVALSGGRPTRLVYTETP